MKFGNSNTYRFLDPIQEDRTRYPVPNLDNARIYERLVNFCLFVCLFLNVLCVHAWLFYVFSFYIYFTNSRSPRPLSPTDPSRENIETTFDLEGNIETISTHSGTREDNRSLGSSSENRYGFSFKLL